MILSRIRMARQAFSRGMREWLCLNPELMFIVCLAILFLALWVLNR